MAEIDGYAEAELIDQIIQERYVLCIGGSQEDLMELIKLTRTVSTTCSLIQEEATGKLLHKQNNPDELESDR